MDTLNSLPLSHAIVAVYRGWRAAATANSGFMAGLYVLSNDLAETTVAPAHFNDLAEVAAALDRLILRVKSEDIIARDYTASKLQQSAAYLAQKPGDAITTDTLMKRGILHMEVTDEDLANLKNRLTETVAMAAGTETPETISDYLRTPIPISSVVSALREKGAEYSGKLRAILPWLSPFQFHVSERSADQPWINVVTNGEYGPEIIVNTSQKSYFTRGNLDLLGAHEVCGHALHFSQLRANRLLQEKAPHLLCLANHTIDSYQLEAVAQFFQKLIVKLFRRSNLERIHLARYELTTALRHRVLSDLITQRSTMEEAVAFHLSYDDDDPVVRRRIYEMIAKDPFFGAQALTYYPALVALDQLLDLDPQVLERPLRILLNEFMAPTELGTFAARNWS